MSRKRKRDSPTSEPEDDVWRCSLKSSIRMSMKPKNFDCCQNCTSEGLHVAGYKMSTWNICKVEERELNNMCPKCGLSVPKGQSQAKHFRQCNRMKLARSAGGVVWVKFDIGWYPGLLCQPTKEQQNRNVYPVQFYKEPRTWEVIPGQHEYRLAVSSPKYRQKVGLLTKGSRIEVEFFYQSGVRVWRTGTVVCRREGTLYMCKFDANCERETLRSRADPDGKTASANAGRAVKRGNGRRAVKTESENECFSSTSAQSPDDPEASECENIDAAGNDCNNDDRVHQSLSLARPHTFMTILKQESDAETESSHETSDVITGLKQEPAPEAEGSSETSDGEGERGDLLRTPYDAASGPGLDEAGNDCSNDGKVHSAFAHAKLRALTALSQEPEDIRESKRQRTGPGWRQLARQKCADASFLLLVDLEVVPFRVVELPRTERTVKANEGWFSFLYWDMAEIPWPEIKQHRGVIKHPINLKVINKNDHPACGGIGAFASSAITEGYKVCYGGFLTVAGERSNSSYIAPYGHSTLDCDAEPAGSEGRFINDHRNTGRAKNVELRRHIDPVTGEVSIVGQVIAPIRAGCELLTSYGSKSYWECLELSDAAAMKHEETLALGTRISVKYYVDGQTTWFRGTVAEILAHGEYNVEFDVGTIETIRATAEYKILPCPAYTDATWPSSTVEHVSGYKWDSQLKFRHFYSAHRYMPLRFVGVLKRADGQLSLYTTKRIDRGAIMGAYSGRVSRHCTSPAALPIGGGCFVVDCGNEFRYLRHCFTSGNCKAVVKHSEITGHVYVAIVCTAAIPGSGEVVLDRSGDATQCAEDYAQLRDRFPDLVPDRCSTEGSESAGDGDGHDSSRDMEVEEALPPSPPAACAEPESAPFVPPQASSTADIATPPSANKPEHDLSGISSPRSPKRRLPVTLDNPPSPRQINAIVV